MKAKVELIICELDNTWYTEEVEVETELEEIEYGDDALINDLLGKGSELVKLPRNVAFVAVYHYNILEENAHEKDE